MSSYLHVLVLNFMEKGVYFQLGIEIYFSINCSFVIHKFLILLPNNFSNNGINSYIVLLNIHSTLYDHSNTNTSGNT